MFDPNIKIGTVLSEKDIHRIFGCQTTFGIRLNKANHAIVIVSDATTKNSYPDYWKDDILYYTGTDAGNISGNQTLEGTGNNNGKLRDVWFEPVDNKTTLFLFIKYAPNQCTYKGIVELAECPFEEPKKHDPAHTVWKFPLKLVSSSIQNIQQGFHHEEHLALKSDFSFLHKTVFKLIQNPNTSCVNQKRTVTSSYYERNPLISAYVKKRSEGICDLCGCSAPFSTHDGYPYLESHHIIWLSRGGEDVPDNMAALCPNCHKKMHVVNSDNDKHALLLKVQQYRKRNL